MDLVHAEPLVATGGAIGRQRRYLTRLGGLRGRCGRGLFRCRCNRSHSHRGSLGLRRSGHRLGSRCHSRGRRDCRSRRRSIDRRSATTTVLDGATGAGATRLPWCHVRILRARNAVGDAVTGRRRGRRGSPAANGRLGSVNLFARRNVATQRRVRSVNLFARRDVRRRHRDRWRRVDRLSGRIGNVRARVPGNTLFGNVTAVVVDVHFRAVREGVLGTYTTARQACRSVGDGRTAIADTSVDEVCRNSDVLFNLGVIASQCTEQLGLRQKSRLIEALAVTRDELVPISVVGELLGELLGERVRHPLGIRVHDIENFLVAGRDAIGSCLHLGVSRENDRLRVRAVGCRCGHGGPCDGSRRSRLARVPLVDAVDTEDHGRDHDDQGHPQGESLSRRHARDDFVRTLGLGLVSHRLGRGLTARALGVRMPRGQLSFLHDFSYPPSRGLLC